MWIRLTVSKLDVMPWNGIRTGSLSSCRVARLFDGTYEALLQVLVVWRSTNVPLLQPNHPVFLQRLCYREPPTDLKYPPRSSQLWGPRFGVVIGVFSYASYLEQFRRVETPEDQLHALSTHRAPVLDPRCQNLRL